MREAQLVKDRNLALKLSKTYWKLGEQKKGEGHTSKVQEGTDKGILR